MEVTFKTLTENSFQEFLFSNEHIDEREFVLKHKNFFGIASSIIADQLIGRRKAKSKLPTFYKTKGIIYPPSINLEQSSSEATAIFKAAIINQHLDKKSLLGLDLTGGLGIDSFFLGKICSSFHYVEKEEAVKDLAHHNHKILGAINIEYYCTDAEEFILSTKNTFDFVFIDPSRRIKDQKVFKFADCEPAVDRILPRLFELTSYVLIKSSPLMDLQQGIKELPYVKAVYVVSVDNECKEVLFLCERNFVQQPIIHCVELTSSIDPIKFTFEEERNAMVNYSEPLEYLYEPNSSLLKAGAFKFIAKHFELTKLNVNTHLYTSHSLIRNFPGRVFKIEKANPTEAELKKYLPDGKANVVTRNYPISAEELKKKLKLKDGGDLFVIGTQSSKKMILLAKRVIANFE